MQLSIPQKMGRKGRPRLKLGHDLAIWHLSETERETSSQSQGTNKIYIVLFITGRQGLKTEKTHRGRRVWSPTF
jgi:hypothetical protein